MRRLIALPALVLLALTGPGFGQELPLHPYSDLEGFETNSVELGLWAHNGSAPEVSFNGATEERACEGKRSLKLDVTLGDGSYYYFGQSLRVPCAGELKISARVLVADGTTARVGFGTNMVYPPSTHSGCSPLTTFEKPTGDWQLVTGDLVAAGREGAAGVISSNTANLSGKDVGAYLDRWSLFIYGSPGQRAVVYLDDVRVEGRVPSEEDYQKSLQANWARATAPFRQRVQDWRKQFDAARAGSGPLDQAPPEAAKLVASLQANERRAEELLAQMERDGYASGGQISGLQGALAAIRSGPETLRAIAAAIQANRPLLALAGGNAVSYARQAGEQALLSSAGTSLDCAACRGEYESLSAVVYALRDLKGLQAKVSDLRGPAGVIPASVLDLRVVKWWYQGASGGIGFSPTKALLPELLLKDDALVRVETDKQDNYLRSTRPDGGTEYLLCSGPDSSNLADVRPLDAADLQPVDVPAQSSREFWINVHIPAAARAGTYAGTITFTCAAGAADLPLRVTVRPFDLQPSRLIYSIYYRACLSPEGQPTIGSEVKSEEQYRAEIADMAAHGVLYPTNYQSRGDGRLIGRMLEIRREAGLPAGRFYNLGAGVGPQGSPEALATMVDELKAWMALLKPFGYDRVYFYGMDEATGDALLSQKKAWKAAQDAGARTFVACYHGTFEAMGALLNCAVLAGAPDPEEARKWHSVGSEAFCYANPQVGVEDPVLYRRNFGLVLWKAGFDGAMDYAYQHGFGHVWNDFDDRTYRDHVFAYPTVNGVVDTIEWEGFREAVDDVRYVTTLEVAIAQATQKHPALAQQAQQWLKDTDLSGGDLDQARAQIADWIVKLQAAMGQ